MIVWIASRALSPFMAVSLIILLAGGCGFQLRTWDLGSNIDSFFVEVAGNNPLETAVHAAMRQAGVTPAESASSAQVVVSLMEYRRSRRGASVNARARVAEYRLNLSVRYAVRTVGKQLLAPQWARSGRVYQVDRENLVGSNEEQELLEREMRSDLVGQIIRAVNAGTTEPVSAD